MLRKTALILSSLIISTPTWANVISVPTWASGFYAGIGIGPNVADFDQSARILVRDNTGIVRENIHDGRHFSGTGMFGTLFGGYQWNCQQFYLAGEINGDLRSLVFKSYNDEFVHGTFTTTDYKIQNSFGISILPGYLYRPCTLFYGRVGYAIGNFKTSTEDSSLVNVNRHLNGFRLGLGVKESFTPNFAARMEYSQTMYQTTEFTARPATIIKTTKITPTTGQVEFGLIFEC